MSAPIEAREVSLQTATVSIQTLNVNGKQMTLAVFRQLPIITDHEDDPEGANLWGKVLYEIKDQGKEWILLEHSGRLYRRRPRFHADFEARRWVQEVSHELKYLQHAGMEIKRAEKEQELLQAREALSEAIAIVARTRQVFHSLPQLFIAV